MSALNVNVQPRITIYLRNASNIKEKNKQTSKKGPIKHRDNAEENKQKSIFNIFRAIKDTTSIKQTQEAIKEINGLERALKIRNMVVEYKIQ